MTAVYTGRGDVHPTTFLPGARGHSGRLPGRFRLVIDQLLPGHLLFAAAPVLEFA